MERGLADAFTAAVEEVLGEIGLEVALAVSPELTVLESDSGAGFIATVGIVGDARGSLLIRMDRQTAGNIVAAMYRSLGLENPEPDEISEAAIAEVANQICGRAVTILSRSGLACDITPPAVISGTDLTSSLPGTLDLERRHVHGSFGTLQVFLGLGN